MKKVISIAIALALCLGFLYIPSGASGAGLDYETAYAYADILSNSFGGKNGLYGYAKFARVLDMDGDGKMELLVFSTGGQGEPGTTVHIWTMRNGRAETAVEYNFDSPFAAAHTGCSFDASLITDGRRKYVHVSIYSVTTGSYRGGDNDDYFSETNSGNTHEDIVIGTGGISFHDQYSYFWRGYYDENGNTIREEETFENGVTEEAYNQKVAAYLSGKTIEEIDMPLDGGLWAEEYHGPSYTETMRQLLPYCIRTDNTATATKYGTYQIVCLDSPYYDDFILSFDAAMVERKTISVCWVGSAGYEGLLEQGITPEFNQEEVIMVTVRPDSMIHVLGGDNLIGINGKATSYVGNNIKLSDSSYAFADAVANIIYTGIVKDYEERLYYNDGNINFISKEDGVRAYADDTTYLIRLGEPVPSLPFTIDYSQASTFTEPQQYIDALIDALTDAERLTDEGNANLTTYLNYAAVNSAGVTVPAKNNIAEIQAAKAGESAEKARGIYETLKAIVDEHGIELQRIPEIIARVHAAGLDWTKPVQLQIGKEAFSATKVVDELLLTLGDLQHTVRVCPGNFEGLDGVILQIEPIGENEYHIVFLDGDGNTLDRIETPVTISLPAPDALSTVQAVHAGATDNWGGQYDPQNQSIAFQTAFSGDYTVLEQPVQINDVGGLSEEQQAVIAFMISKGYFSTDSDGNFNPGRVLSRYHLATALVRIFFALDRSLETTFTDVPTDSPYYPYVASGQANEIINGFEDGTYRGDSDVLRSQLIALCSRTLANRKGYLYPEDIDAYLNFEDADTIKEWARKEVALAVREGLIESGGRLEPEQPITRAEAAEMLYRLFMLLYEVAPAPMTEVEESEPAPVELEIAEMEITNEQPIRESAEKTERLEENTEEKNSTSRLPWILVSLGGIAILASGILLMKKQRKQ